MDSTRHFVFLSHNSSDKPAVEELAHRLRAQGVEPWVDAWNLIPGQKWQPAMEKALTEARASVVFIGPSGIGPWQDEEMRVAIDRRVGDSVYRVVPVLLPGAHRGKRSAVPPFLANVTWVEFQRSLDEELPFLRLLAGIRGVEPGAPLKVVAPGANPYRGLKAFDVADNALYFGRESLTGWLLSDIRSCLANRGEMRLLAVVGASGSGKSSLARAGLLAKLRAGALEGSESWSQIVLKPGADPLESLAMAGADTFALGADRAAVLKFQDDLGADPRMLHTQAALALRGVSSGTRAVLLADQFEEIFTLCDSEERRRAFIDNLLHACAVADGPIVLVLTLRADFLGKCAAYPRLAAALSDGQELVGPMSREELREAIERPGWQAGCEFQAGLVDALLDEAATQPGGLPLLQHALFELWGRREGRRLTHAAYEQIGGVKGALARRADEVYRGFSAAEQEMTRHILMRLTQPGEGTEDTRRRALLTEIVPSAETAPMVERLVRALADERLLVTEGDSVDVAHEALIQGWPTLREWIDQDREGLREHRRLTNAAEEWQRLSRDESFLFRGLRLAQALRWRADHAAALNLLEREFLDASASLREDEDARKLAQRREREEQRERELRQAQRLAEEAEKRRAEEALRLAQQRKLSWIVSLVALVAIVFGSASGFFWWQSNEQRNIAEAGRLASESQLELNRRFDLSLLLAVASTHASPTVAARSSLLAGVQSHPHLRAFLGAHKEAVIRVAFSPDGKTLASASFDNTVILWDVAARKPLGEPLTGHKDRVYAVAFSPDGKTLASASSDNTVILWDVAARKPLGEPLAGHKGVVGRVAFSPDGKTLALTSSDKTVILWDVAARKPLGEPLAGHKGAVPDVAFSPDGKTLASASEDETVILWDVAARKPLGEPLAGHKGAVYGVAFSPDGKTLASASEDGTVILWDVAARKPLGEPLAGHKGKVSDGAFSPDGKTLASASEDKTVILWDVAARKPLGEPLAGHKENVSDVAFSPDGKTLASASVDGTVILWDVTARKPLGEPLAGHKGAVHDVAFSPDGKTLASASSDNTVILWDVAARKPLGEPLAGHKKWVIGVAFSPDGKTLASASWDKTVILWDVAARKPLGEPLAGHSEPVIGVAFSPDGKTLASASEDGTVILWDVAARKPLGEPLAGHKEPVSGVAFSPDGKTLASASEDGTVILWDVAARKPLGEPLAGHKEPFSGVAFSPDGKTLASASFDNTVILWDVAPDSWRDQACTIANRNLTCEEWRNFMGERPYRKVCESLPAPECR